MTSKNNNDGKTDVLPIIRLDFENSKEVVYCNVPAEVDDDFFKKTVDQARKEVPDDVIFSWWLTEALKETIEKLESEKEEDGKI